MSRLFQPDGLTVALAASDVSTRETLPAKLDVYRILVIGEATVFIAFGGADVVAEIPATGQPRACMPFTPGDAVGLTPPAGVTHFAAICEADGNGIVYVTGGAGI